MKRTGFSSKLGLWVNASLISLFILIFASSCGDSADDDGTGSGDTEKSEARKPAITIDPSPRGSGLSTAPVVRTFDLPDGFFESDFARGGTAGQILERDGGEFGEVMSASFNLSAETLEVKGTENELWVIEAVVDYWKLSERTAHEERAQKLRDKLMGIVIPKVDFKDTPLSEALLFLEEAADLANVPISNGTTGVKIVLDPPDGLDEAVREASNPGVEITPESTVTLSLTNVYLLDALRYTAVRAQRSCRIGETEIRLGHSDGSADFHFVQAYLAPPEMAQIIAEQSPPQKDDPFIDPSVFDTPFVPTVRSYLRVFVVLCGKSQNLSSYEH